MPVASRLSRAKPTVGFKNAYQLWRSHAFTDTITTLFTSNNTVILSEQSESKDPRLLFAHQLTNSGCPIHFAHFAKWVGNHEPQPAFQSRLLHQSPGLKIETRAIRPLTDEIV